MLSEILRRAHGYEKTFGDAIPAEGRPVYHLSPRVGWMNDPNGFSFHGGQYHLFYQYHPYSTQWGPMHWGHAVSRDLLRWEYLPAAMGPDMPYDKDGCFSGSAIQLPDGRHLLMYTGVTSQTGKDGVKEVFQTQCLAVGDGLHYEKYEGNPVLDGKDLPAGFSARDFRDPKIFPKAGGGFGCVVGNRTDDGSGAVLLFESEDGFHWHFASVLDRSRNELGRMWECPDLFRLEDYDVIVTSPQEMRPQGLEFHNGNNTMAMIGKVKEGSFHRQWVQTVDYGLDFYAPQTMEAPDGRRILIGWMQNWETVSACPEDAKWFGQMTVPRELCIRDSRLVQNPVRELETLRCRPVTYQDVPVQGEISLPGVSGRVIDLTVTVKAEGDCDWFRIQFARDSHHHCALTYDRRESTLHMSRIHAGFNRDMLHERKCPVDDRGGEIKLRILLDRFSAEVFVNDGRQAMTMTFPTALSAADIRFACGGRARIWVEKYDLMT